MRTHMSILALLLVAIGTGAARAQPYIGRVPVCHEAKAVVLYLMNPLWSAGRLPGRTRQARLKSGMGLLGAYSAPQLTRY